jgi:thiol:disulfide interchange protein
MKLLQNRTARRVLNVLLWGAVLALLAWRVGPQAAAALGVGAPDSDAPALAVTTLDGDEVSLAGLRGQVVLVNFWATWCPPCRMEMPGFQRVWDSRRERGLVVLGLSNERGDEPGVPPSSGSAASPIP